MYVRMIHGDLGQVSSAMETNPYCQQDDASGSGNSSQIATDALFEGLRLYLCPPESLSVE